MHVGCLKGTRAKATHPQRPHISSVCICQTMMSSQVQPGQCQGRHTAEPFIHDVKAQPAKAGVQFRVLSRDFNQSACARRASARQPSLRMACRAVASGAGEGWWSQTGSNRRPHACKARALPTELWPLISRSRPQREPSSISSPAHRVYSCGVWWAQADSNCRPHAYQACALTT